MSGKALGGHITINSFVAAKLRRLPKDGLSFDQLFEMMFSEKDNVMFESSRGKHITEVSYGECRDSILKLAGKMKALFGDIPQQSVIGLYMDNSREWIETFWAILLSGFCPLLMNLRLDGRSLENTLANASAKAVIATGEAQFTVPAYKLSDIASRDKSLGLAGSGQHILLMSSGTTEHIKLCEYNAAALRCIIENSYCIIRECPRIKKHYRGKLKLLAFLPFYHIFGLVAVYIWFAFFARTFVLIENMSPNTILYTIRRHAVTHIFAVPLFWNSVYEQALKAIRQRGDKTFDRFNICMKLYMRIGCIPVISGIVGRVLFKELRQNLFGSSVCFMISGGSELKTDVAEFFNAVGYHLANGYGMTEIGITSVELSNDRRFLNGASIGKPFANVDYKVGEKGTLEVRTAGMAQRIYEGDKWVAAGGWFETGDLVEEIDGHWYILGRRDDLVISPSGENLNPNLVESALMCDGIDEICLIGAKTGSVVKPVLLVNPKHAVHGENLQILRGEIINKISQSGLEGQISAVMFVNEPLIGETDIKLNRLTIARRYSEGAFTIIDPDRDTVGEATELKDKLRSMFAEAIGITVEMIGDDTDFFTGCSGNSLDYLSVVAQLQEEYNIPFPIDDGKSLTTVNSLAGFIIRTVKHDDL